ncbi:MAG: M48 family metallopeptidase [Zoogloeaceae bacterium]|nr:M48 family metallopeptidase [Zoogloeaceae bacterium]
MNIVTTLFLIALGVSLLLQIGLSLRHIRHVRAHRAAVPEAFAERIPLDAHRKAADYTVTRTRFGLINLAWSTVLLLGWTLGGGFAWLDSVLSASLADWSPVAIGVAVLLAATVIGSLLDLPFDAWKTFRIEQAFGFNRSTPALFLRDLGMQLLLTLLLGAPLAWAALSLMIGAGEYWWAWVWLLWSGFVLLMLWAFPTVIAPLFNKFTPLADGALRERIENLLTRCGFRSDGIFVMDGSRRSAHGNAYFTGIGNNKRIVFFDTLLDGLDGDEVEAVLAHELGHFRRQHVRKHLLASLILSGVGLYVLSLLAEWPAFHQGLGVETGSAHAVLFLFLLVAPLFTVVLHPIASMITRKHEFEADDYAAEHSRADKLISALVKLYRENASTLTPDPWYSAFHDSHPPAPVRIARLSAKLAPST